MSDFVRISIFPRCATKISFCYTAKETENPVLQTNVVLQVLKGNVKFILYLWPLELVKYFCRSSSGDLDLDRLLRLFWRGDLDRAARSRNQDVPLVSESLAFRSLSQMLSHLLPPELLAPLEPNACASGSRGSLLIRSTDSWWKPDSCKDSGGSVERDHERWLKTSLGLQGRTLFVRTPNNVKIVTTGQKKQQTKQNNFWPDIYTLEAMRLFIHRSMLFCPKLFLHAWGST